MLYRFAAPTLEVTDPFAVLKPPSTRSSQASRTER
jgi:hypothetical protein